MPKPKLVKLSIPSELAEKIHEVAKQNPDHIITVGRHTMMHAEHREALSEEMAEKFKIRKRTARDLIEGIAEDTGMK